jgi:molecular chaperone GrpE
MTQNTQTKMADESPVYVDEADIFHPIEDETIHLREELEAERDKRLRLAAEYENYRRRTKREIAQAADEGKRELLERMLSIADDLDVALANADESPDAVAEGLRIIHQRFSAMLEANGFIGFESKGEEFDPERHEAFDVIAAGENETGRVNTEIRRGYFWNDKLLRPALVVVAQ